MSAHTHEALVQYQSLPLTEKIEMTKMRIRQWYEHWDGEVYVAFSGGKDSTVLLDIVRSVYPNVPAVFCDTGLEYPETRDFVKSIANVEWLKPKKTFVNVLKEHGYPVISKEISRNIKELRQPNGATQTRRDVILGSGRYSIPKKWRYLIEAPFKISDYCCSVMKKQPFHRYEKQTGRKGFIGTMAGEGALRRSSWIKHGCNAFDIKRPQSRPISFWTEQDVLTYVRDKQIPISAAYGQIVYDWKGLTTSKEKRTGCMFCPIGAQYETPNRFQRMAKEHPQQYRFCMENLGMKEVLEYCGISA